MTKRRLVFIVIYSNTDIVAGWNFVEAVKILVEPWRKRKLCLVQNGKLPPLKGVC